MSPTYTPLTPQAEADEILHGLFSALTLAAAMFVKNDKSRAKAASIVNLMNAVVLPTADQLLNPPKP